tara:strand:- start:26790 stop:27032 length:243 start_codon:yes stop_codon:yes gene_type:complete
MTRPNINDYDLELVSKVLAKTNPGRVSSQHIVDRIQTMWPFSNIATGGWVAYAESPDTNNNVRVALTPYTQAKFLEKLDG